MEPGTLAATPQTLCPAGRWAKRLRAVPGPPRIVKIVKLHEFYRKSRIAYKIMKRGTLAPARRRFSVCERFQVLRGS